MTKTRTHPKSHSDHEVRRHHAAWLLALSAAAILAPLIWATATNLDHASYATPIADDHAVIELYTLRATRFEQLLGPYSRFRIHHPGPLLFYTLAPLYALTDFSAGALSVTALIVNTLSVAFIIAVAWDPRRPFQLPAVGVGVLLLLGHLGAFTAYSFWNPHIGILPSVAAILAILLRPDHAPSMIGAVALGSLAAQSHWMWVFPLGCSSAVWLLTTIRQQRRRGVASVANARAPSPLAPVVVTALILWSPVVIDVISNGGGNVRSVASTDATLFGGSKEAHNSTLWTGIGDPLYWLAGNIGAERIPDQPETRGLLSLTVLTAFALGILITARNERTRLVVTPLAALLGAGTWGLLTRDQHLDYLVLPHAVVGSVLLVTSLLAIGALGSRKNGVATTLVLVSANIVMSAGITSQFASYLSIRDYLASGWGPAAYDWAPEEGQRWISDNAENTSVPIIVTRPQAWPIAAAIAVMVEKSGGRTLVEGEWKWMLGAQPAEPGRPNTGLIKIAPRRRDHRVNGSWDIEVVGWCDSSAGAPLQAAWFDGFYPSEDDSAHGTVRWSKGPDSTLLLCRGEGGESAAGFHVRPYSPDGRSVLIAATVDGAQRPTRTLEPGWSGLTIPLDARDAPATHRIQLRYEPVRQPCDFEDSPDCRQLAVLFSAPHTVSPLEEEESGKQEPGSGG